MLEHCFGHPDLRVEAVRSFIPHLQDLTAAHLAHVHHQLVDALLQVLLVALPLPFPVAVVVVNNFLPIQVQEGACSCVSVEVPLPPYIHTYIYMYICL